VFEAVTDPNVAPIPPHISLEQTKKFVSSVVKGDAQALGCLKQIVRDIAAGFVPAKK
jgi:pyruvate dehydrogenase (quinone)